MATYNGLFLRSNLDQVNTVPKPGALSSSPDIVPYGIAPMDNPVKTLTDNYNSDLGKPLEGGKTNYIYLRAKNYSTSRISDDTDGNRPRLFYSKASLLTYPNKWNELTLTPSHKPLSIAADAGGIGVMSEPVVWAPDNIDGDHYCMIAQVPSPGYDNKIPDTLQIADFAGWVAQNGGIAWRNIIVVNSTTVTLTGSKLYYDQGDDGASIQFTVMCVNVPIGSKISFSAGAPGPNPPIFLQPTVVSTYPSFNTGVTCDVPAKYISDIYFNLEAPPGVTDLSTAKVTIQAAYPTPPGSALFTLGHTSAELGIPTPDGAYGRIRRQLEKSGEPSKLEAHHEQYLEQLTDLQAATGPSRLIVVGANSWLWKKQ
jgi:hypothetical protein